MDLQNPTAKMGKSDGATAGIVYLLDEPETIVRKVRRAVTDSAPVVTYEPQERAGVANLLEILSACTGKEPAVLAESYEGAGALKADTAEAVVELLRPLRARHAELSAESGYVDGVLREGAAAARAIARPTVDAAYRAIGLLPPM
jgi:tryptophanyl-tRNA synthetase